MDFADDIKTLAARVEKTIEHLRTEEATKTSLVLPFIQALGYNVFDPLEVVPEYTIEVGTKKDEKIDYAIMMDGEPIILIECKSVNGPAKDQHFSQLVRYFTLSKCRFAVLTNGITYKFYTDADEPSKMDQKPFFEFSMLELTDHRNEHLIEEIKRFAKNYFDLQENISAATELKYSKEIRRIFASELQSPSDDFVKFFASQVYSGKLTQSVRQQFADITKRSLKRYISDQLNERLKSALTSEQDSAEGPTLDEQESDESTIEEVTIDQDVIDAFNIVKSIYYKVVDVDRVQMSVKKSYVGVYLDGNKYKPLCRFYFYNSVKSIGVFDEEKNVEKQKLDDLKEIYGFESKLLQKIDHYENPVKKAPKVSADVAAAIPNIPQTENKSAGTVAETDFAN